MKILLQKINVISPGSPHHMQLRDVLIEKEKIIDIGEAGKLTSAGAEIITGKNLYVSTGWFDLHVNFSEPGEEYKEDVISGCKAANQGGFTGVLIMPSTHPAISNKPSVEFILQKAKHTAVNINVAGSISDNQNGKDLSEMYDMHLAGAKVFTDDKQAVQDAGLMVRALQYAGNFGGRIFSFAEDAFLASKGQVNEGIISTQLGLKGIPSIAEESMINRDLLLAEYTQSPIHFSTISSGKSVDLIRKAKNKGIKVTADVSSNYLLLDDSSLQGFDSIYKLKPPLRSGDDRKALLEGLKDGTLDCICSDHHPQNPESKMKEFELAAFGASGIETAFAVARTATHDNLSLPELISKFTIRPRSCAGLKTGIIDKDQYADLTIFDPDEKWIVKEQHLLSKSKNNPFLGKELIGKPVAVINKGQLIKCV